MLPRWWRFTIIAVWLGMITIVALLFCQTMTITSDTRAAACETAKHNREVIRAVIVGLNLPNSDAYLAEIPPIECPEDIGQ